MKSYAVRMWRLIQTGVALAALLCLSSGCQDTSGQSRPDGETIRVKIPVVTNGKYRLEVVELTTVHEMLQLRGEAARFLFSPTVKDNQLMGFEPRIRTIKNSDGVYVGQDSLSVQMLALYASFEKLMKLDEKLGVKDLNQWPRPVAVNTKVMDASGSFSRDNARFSGQLDGFLFEPFTHDDLPLTVNAGVIGHEHFHSLFFQLVLKPLGGAFTQNISADLHQTAEWERASGLATSETDLAQNGTALTEKQIYDLTLLRGINEGLADVWGWIFSGDTNFVGRSLVFEKQRDLKQEAEPIDSSAILSERWAPARSTRETLDDSYVTGRNIAKLLRAVTDQETKRLKKEDNAQAVRLDLARAILRTLPELKKGMEASSDRARVRPAQILEILSVQIPFLSDESCKLIRDKVADESKEKICQSRALSTERFEKKKPKK